MAMLEAAPVRWSTKNSFLHVEDECVKPRRPRCQSDATHLRGVDLFGLHSDADSEGSTAEGSAAADGSGASTPQAPPQTEYLLSMTPQEPYHGNYCAGEYMVQQEYLLPMQYYQGYYPGVPEEKKPKKRREAPPPQDEEITLMVRNIPNKYTPDALFQTFAPYRSSITFFYLPIDFKNKCNLGYAFVNFDSQQVATRFTQEHDNSKLPQYEKSEKVLLVQPARVQGLAANVKRFRNSSVMGVLPDEYKPMLFEKGVQKPFPSPGKKLPPVGPRFRPNA